MAESKLTIGERQVGDVTVLTLTGQILLDDGDLALRKQIHGLVERGFVKVVLDLGGVSYIDSSGVGMIVAKLKTLKERGGDMKLLHLDRRAESLFSMLKLLILFETFQAEAEAVRSVGQPERDHLPRERRGAAFAAPGAHDRKRRRNLELLRLRRRGAAGRRGHLRAHVQRRLLR